MLSPVFQNMCETHRAGQSGDHDGDTAGIKRHCIEFTDPKLEGARTLLPFLRCVCGDAPEFVDVDDFSNCLDLMIKYEVSTDLRAATVSMLKHYHMGDSHQRLYWPEGDRYARAFQLYAFFLALKHNSMSTALAILPRIKTMRWAAGGPGGYPREDCAWAKPGERCIDPKYLPVSYLRLLSHDQIWALNDAIQKCEGNRGRIEVFFEKALLDLEEERKMYPDLPGLTLMP